MTDNELIAEFMGWERYSHNSFKCPNIYPIENSTRAGWTTFSGKELQFHTSWDWLMPVVEKIETMHYGSYACRIVKDRCVIYDIEIAEQSSVYAGIGKGILASTVNTEPKIMSVYWAVVEFIKWYNEQKSSSD